jgi:hypothetical protein
MDSKDNYGKTELEHFVDLEIEETDPNKVCFRRKTLPPGASASIGDTACVRDKITQFGAFGTDAEGQLLAFRF